MKRSTIALLAIAFGLAVAGCASDTANASNGTGVSGYTVVHVNVDGRTITCIEGTKSDISCDWTQR